MEKNKIIPEQRRNQILDYLKSKKTTTIQEICSNFNLSKITIRRDFNILEKKQLIRKVYGGAAIIESNNEEPFLQNRINIHSEQKKVIAREALKRVSSNETILLESGTTCIELANLLYTKKNLNIITAAPHIVNYLTNLKREGLFTGEVFCCGGVWRGDPDDLFIGPHAMSFFDNVIIDISFFGIISLSLTEGWMAPSIYEVELTNKIISCSKKVIGIADSSKFNKTSFAKIGPLSLFDEIITDNQISEEDFIKYNELVKITIASDD